MSMRIAFAGAGGTGKGTLGKILTDHYHIPFINSFISDIGKMMSMKNYMDVESEQDALVYQYSILFGQIAQEHAVQQITDVYISERSVYDYIPYYLEKGLSDDKYLDIIHKWGNENYDLIVFLPVCFTPSDKNTNTWRERDDEKRQRTSNIILTALNDNYTGKIIELNESDLGKRKEIMIDYIGKHSL